VAGRRDLDGHRRRPPDLKAGDVVEIEITGIGTLRNKFVAEKI
jgi:2-keto-4-pentenoate hydratase/2-oxohepta-3-ene-1,7-dioic acid hydratase in catechol pathway